MRVEDNGCGIAEENQSQIFDALFSDRHKVATVGLGLPVSRDLMISNGGRIEVESEIKKGTCVTLFFTQEQE